MAAAAGGGETTPSGAGSTDLMAIRYVRKTNTAHPTGNPDFAVEQSMPGVVPEKECDPFLMCDEFGPMMSTGAYGNDTDEGFDVPWHPHHGMDILSYIVEGVGRHADSMGNRETFQSPGFQWMSVGSGIEHAEGGGTPAGQSTHGFQIWLRMPVANMEDDPRYGTVEPSDIPTVSLDGGLVRVIAGSLDGVQGPAQFAVNVQILDVELEPGAEFNYVCPSSCDNVMMYGFKGSGILNDDTPIGSQQIARFNTTNPSAQGAKVTAGEGGFRMMVFTGKMTKEKYVWHGPFVCSSRANLMQCFQQVQTGQFPPVRVKWDYKDASKTPKGQQQV